MSVALSREVVCGRFSPDWGWWVDRGGVGGSLVDAADCVAAVRVIRVVFGGTWVAEVDRVGERWENADALGSTDLKGSKSMVVVVVVGPSVGSCVSIGCW